MFFLAGIISYRIYDRLRGIDFPSWTGLALAILVLAFIALTNALTSDDLWFNFTNTIPTAALYAVMVVSIPLLFAATRTSRRDRTIGDASYPIYVNHFLVMSLVIHLWPTEWPKTYFGIMLFAGSAALASATLFLIELPIERLRARIAHKSDVAR